MFISALEGKAFARLHLPMVIGSELQSVASLTNLHFFAGDRSSVCVTDRRGSN